MDLGFVGFFDTVLLKFRKYHKMVYSYYPFMFSVGFLGLLVGLLLYMNFGIFFCFFLCLVFVFYVSFLWLKDVFLEDISGQYTVYDYRMFEQGFRLFLFSELILFFSVF